MRESSKLNPYIYPKTSNICFRMEVKIESSWKSRLFEEFEMPYFEALTDFVRQEYATKTVYPPGKLIFHAFEQSPFDLTKVIILGQDPYHGPGQAHGLCFSVPEGIDLPPSLQNIFKEISQDMGITNPSSGNLDRWASQGVLLLNSTLTVQANRAGSHQNRGWEKFTDQVIQVLAKEKEHLVFLLWGSFAQKKGEFIDRTRHLVLSSPHPSPLSSYRGFFGNKHFSKTNEYLKLHGIEPVKW